MAPSRSALFSLLLSALPLVSAQECTLQFDGRTPDDFAAADFDANNNIFSPDNVFGQGLSFGQLIKLPNAGLSIFDDGTAPFEVTISDDSIFPLPRQRANGLPPRRAHPGLQLRHRPSTTGVKTLHFSLMKDAARPLNLSHEYQLVFLESNDFSTNQVVLKTGTILGGNTADPDTLQLFGNVNQGNLLFSTAFTAGVFHNFGVLLDFNALLLLHRLRPLEEQTDAIANDVSGQGQFHFGVLKKPTDSAGDITKDGFQEAGIDEGIIFGGIFQEDSSDGCISLSL
ncbi:unnamed protein product [Parascedosporium putredinis]|uniref:Glycoside hydrolase 131 catalytic N-terminal domain-containing protein n=1 Tax=Parascedosporium putredinis TaxID=1442378 RepID=A0A9P1GZF7_9PEZI|nr:unnamed protein product [Parascedosporium putredinis]CAI7991741.1 unnamed protein product [Parascedosporium putredinis]